MYNYLPIFGHLSPLWGSIDAKYIRKIKCDISDVKQTMHLEGLFMSTHSEERVKMASAEM